MSLRARWDATLVYINDLPQESAKFNFIMYADDTILIIVRQRKNYLFDPNPKWSDKVFSLLIINV